MRLRFLVVFGLSLIASQAGSYYIDSVGGQDSNSGTSANAPWKSLEKVNATVLHSGDRVLFKAGGTWNGQLAPRRSGGNGTPVRVDRYASGPKPKIDGNGEVEDVLRLYNVQNIEVRNLEITNHGAERAIRRGVHIFLNNFGTAKHIVVAGLYIHDVNGVNGNGDKAKDNGGIIFRTIGDKTPSRFDGLMIERNLIRTVDRSAIAADSYHAMRTRWYPSVHVVIRDNFVDDVGGDGIVPWATDAFWLSTTSRVTATGVQAVTTPESGPGVPDNSLFQLNEASFTRTTLDGEGFDSDYNSRNTLFQYNTATTTKAASC